ncbi:diguanylate cyclase [Hydrogenovibrio sp. 3SP14C1]|uniref:GGDEF domain-containing protein n=1 Tax=Hydrogenovibrio sp. 3SP14C1 TaxID=3038774 RepID=UPI002417A531|nr:diguanylate cyclase [Hydrogenovibrio sp. 3SP14C1]MDG4811521.1 diguanylate cyclase [Hydrogenovibrio sp. 3SP14C1]
MIEFAQNTALEPLLDHLKFDRRYVSSRSFDTFPDIAANEKSSVKRLLSELQHKFSDSADVAYLIESEVSSRTAELYRRANYDSLTHLPNRAHFHDILENLIQGTTQKESVFSLLFLDLDGFKTVNDTQGHHIGDELLRHVSGRLISSVREEDVVSRLGGDEFVILLAETEDRAEVEDICQRIINEVSRPYLFEGQEVRTSTSIGVSMFPQDSRLASELIETADEALYVSKSKGKQTFRFYNDVKQEVPTHKHVIQAKFDAAVLNAEFAPYVEPQIDLKQNRVVGGYVSMEWLTAENGQQALESWQHLLKESHSEASMSLWLLDSACFYLNQWLKVDAEFVVTVPVLEGLWRQKGFLELLNQRVNQYGIPSSQLQLAFSLKSFETFDQDLKACLQGLSDQGYQLTLTGLGGQAFNFAMLVGLNIQEFKFDEVWLHEQLETTSGQQWIQALIQMAKSLDSCMIATGITSESHVKKLTESGCTLGQGVYWSAPIEAAEFKQLMV